MSENFGQARWHRLGAFSPEQWDNFEYLMTVANTLRLAVEQPDRVKPTLDALYERIGELGPGES